MKRAVVDLHTNPFHCDALYHPAGVDLFYTPYVPFFGFLSIPLQAPVAAPHAPAFATNVLGHHALIRDIAFTPDLAWLNFVQYENVEDVMEVNSRLRWIISPGRDLFLVFNQTFDSRGRVKLVRTAPLVRLEWTFRF